MPFSAIRGQERCIDILKRSIATGKVAHAYLFEGVDGCGKRSTAISLIEAVFCGKETPCGSCPACRKMAKLQHPDFHLIEPDGSVIKIDQIRQLQHELSYRPVEAKKKACIITDADRLNPAAGNALLKTLEEPPGDALIILLTANVGGVLPTILSRCQRLQFSPLAEAVVNDLLRASGIPEDRALIAAALSGGSFSAALRIAGDEAFAARERLVTLATSFSLRDVCSIFGAAEELARDKENVPELLDLLKAFFRDVMFVRNGGDVATNPDLLALVEREANRLSTERIMERIDHITQAEHALQRNVNPRLTLEVLFMRLAS